MRYRFVLVHAVQFWITRIGAALEISRSGLIIVF